MAYQQVKVKLSDGQKRKLGQAVEVGVSIQLRPQNFSGADPLLLTKTQYKQFQSAKAHSHGIRLKMSSAQLKAMKKGGILPFLAPLIPALVAAGKAAALGATTGAASYGIQKAIRAATKGNGLRLKPYPGRGLKKKRR